MEDFSSKMKLINEKLAKIDKLEMEVSELKQTVLMLEKGNNEREQELLSNNIEIHGMPEIANENLPTMMSTIATIIGCPLYQSDIEYVSRISKRNRTQDTTDGRPGNIIAKFTSRKKKDEFIAAIKKKKGITSKGIGMAGADQRIFVNDHLTRKNKSILRSAKRFKNEHMYQFLWVRSGKIYLRKNDTSPPIHVSCDSQLKNLIA